MEMQSVKRVILMAVVLIQLPFASAAASDAAENRSWFPHNPSSVRLPSSVKPSSGALKYFGVDVSALPASQQAIIVSAWTDYMRVTDGEKPECKIVAEFPTAKIISSSKHVKGYFCEGYTIISLQYDLSADPWSEVHVDFLNGQHISNMESFDAL